jgi:hypothetical protein
MSVEVRATPLANKLIEALPRRARRAYDDFETDLARRGCAALAYRLTGSELDHLCVIHLVGLLRVIIAFEAAEIAYVLLVGDHDERSPAMDVYRRLYELVGYSPSGQEARTKPPCCDENESPPFAPELLDPLLARMRRIPANDMRRITTGRRGSQRRRRS